MYNLMISEGLSEKPTLSSYSLARTNLGLTWDFWFLANKRIYIWCREPKVFLGLNTGNKPVFFIWVNGHHFCLKRALSKLSSDIFICRNQLEKLEAAKAAWLVCLSILSLTGSFLLLLGQFLLTLLGLTGPYWALLGFTGLYWAVLGCTGLFWAVLGCTGLY